ncbi:DNA polymerase III subunit delta [Chloroflexota bacterium]
MLYVLFGEDDFSLSRMLEQIKEEIGAADTMSANTTVFDGQQLTLEKLKAACDTVPFLAEKRLVIVEGLLKRFESKAKSGQRKKAGLNQRNDYEALTAYFRQIPEFALLVLIDGKISNTNPLLKNLAGTANVTSFPLMRGSKLQQWVQQRVKQGGGSISPKAVDLLARFVGGNLWIMANEVDKLLLFTAGRCIEEDDVRAVVSYAQEASVFTMVDAILEFKAGVAGEILQQLLRQGAASAYLLVMLSRQVQIIVRVKELTRQGRSLTWIQDKMGLSSDFVVRKALEQAEKYSLARLKEVYHRLLEADLSIKTGRFDGELALNLLITELCYGSAASNPVS